VGGDEGRLLVVEDGVAVGRAEVARGVSGLGRAPLETCVGSGRAEEQTGVLGDRAQSVLGLVLLGGERGSGNGRSGGGAGEGGREDARDLHMYLPFIRRAAFVSLTTYR